MHLCLDSGEPLDHVPMLHVRLAKYIIHEKYVMITHSRVALSCSLDIIAALFCTVEKKWSSFVAKEIQKKKKTNKSKHDIEAMETKKRKGMFGDFGEYSISPAAADFKRQHVQTTVVLGVFELIFSRLSSISVRFGRRTPN